MDDLGEFIKKSRARIEAVLKRLNWTEEDVFREFNSNSKATEEKQESESNSDEESFPPSCTGSNSIVLDEKDLQKLLGRPNVKAAQKFSDLQINFSREDKLLIYEHTVEQKQDVPKPPAEKDLISFGDIVAMRKREKTKRRKYRISKPTQIEEVRSLVELQMEALQQYLETKQKNESDKIAFKKEGEMHYRSKGVCKTEKDNRTHKTRDDESRFSDKREREKYEPSKQRCSENETERKRYDRCSDSRFQQRQREKYRSRSRSRSKRSRSRDRSRSRHKSSHHHHRSKSKKRKKEKHKKHHS